MAPKARSLQQIRRQVAADRKSTAVGSLSKHSRRDTDAPQSVTNNSAFTQIEQKNEHFVHGRAIPRSDPEDLSRSFPPRVTKRQPKKRTKLRSSPTSKRSEPAEPVVEYWRFAGGDNLGSMEEDASTLPTRIVGLARVSAWMLEAFKTSVKEAIEEYGEVRDLMTEQVKDGAEECVDVYAVFRSELVAEVVKDGLDGKLVEGRIVRVRYA